MSKIQKNTDTREYEDTAEVPASAENTEAEQPQNADTGSEPGQKEIGGRGGPDPTRYGDWEKGGRCIDF